MPTARKLPSGSWRCRIYVGKDPSGKKKTVSFTGKTKRDAEQKAAKYAAENRRVNDPDEITVKDAIERYIVSKTAVLSPSTITAYRAMQRNYYDDIASKKIRSLMTEDMQLFISSLVGSVSPKSVANIYGLLSSAVTMFRPDAVFRVTLPNRKKKRLSSPSDEDVATLFEEAGETLRLCIALAAFGSMRRGEICALKHKDVNGCFVNVHADVVKNEQGTYEYKDYPKTSDSVRSVLLPAEVVSLIGDGVDDAFIVPLSPDALSSRFRRLRDRLQMNVRFHDLRHYYASIGVVLGIPDKYLSEFGGWRTDSGVMKEVYQNRIDSAASQYAETMATHFGRVIRGASS